MDFKDWHENNTYNYKQFNIKELVKLKNKKKLKVSLCFPTLNESKTIGKILDIVNKEIKGTKFQKEVVKISKDVLEQLYRELWMRRMFWKNAIK